MTFLRLKKLFCDMMDGEVEADAVTPESRLRADLNFTSMTYLLMVLSIEREFSVSMADARIGELITVQDVCDFIDAQAAKDPKEAR